MSYYFSAANFTGIAEYFRAQSDEERMHGTKIFEFIDKRGDAVEVMAQGAPRKEWASATEAL